MGKEGVQEERHVCPPHLLATLREHCMCGLLLSPIIFKYFRSDEIPISEEIYLLGQCHHLGPFVAHGGEGRRKGNSVLVVMITQLDCQGYAALMHGLTWITLPKTTVNSELDLLYA
jgi:hypothetical protein